MINELSQLATSFDRNYEHYDPIGVHSLEYKEADCPREIEELQSLLDMFSKSAAIAALVLVGHLSGLHVLAGGATFDCNFGDICCEY